jgi:hypothetical protein
VVLDTHAHAHAHAHTHTHTHAHQVQELEFLQVPPVRQHLTIPVLQRCYNSVTVLLQCCYRNVTMVLQWCYKVVTLLLYCCYIAVMVPIAREHLTIPLFERNGYNIGE